MNKVVSKVTSQHLKRDAYLYIRQSSLKQIQCHQESTKRQYALRERAIALGWSAQQIHTIDQDQGRSGAQTHSREGFQYLVSQVSLAKAGIVMGLEVSRLARNSSDWHRLLEICALSDTLILDEDGIYDPKNFNDRLILGMKGTMSEAELHMLKARLQGGMMNKAKRGQLKIPVPVGFLYDEHKGIILDPNARIQSIVNQLFHCFERKKSAQAVVKFFREKGWLFPQRLRRGLNKGELLWGELIHSRVLQILHNPCYAGAYAYGRTQMQYLPSGESRPRCIAREDWHVLIKDAHPGYISWEQYEHHQTDLKNNAKSYGKDRLSFPREGNALLQGLMLCGYCGERMTIRYHMHRGKPSPDYICQKNGIERAKKICQSIIGRHVDKAISELMIQLMSPASLELSIAVQKELAQRWQESDQLWQQQLSDAQYQCDLAKIRYMKVDPDNRLVAATLEAEWNKKLDELEGIKNDYDRYNKEKIVNINQIQRKKILMLQKDFSLIWNAPETAMQDKKQMIRLLLEDVTLKKTSTHIEVHVRCKAGQVHSILLDRPKSIIELRKTDQKVIDMIAELSQHMTDGAIANVLNEKGYKPAARETFNLASIRHIRYRHQIKSFTQHLKNRGYMTATQLSQRLGIHIQTVYKWQKAGLLHGQQASDRGEYFFELPSEIPELRPGSPLKKRKCESKAKH